MIRTPVTQEFLADCIAAQFRGETVVHPAIACFRNALYDDMNRLVHKLSHKFKTTISDSEEEISQNCFLHLFKRIKYYRSSRAKFSTFSTWICSNYLKGYYLKDKRHNERFTCSFSEFGENQEGSGLMCAYNVNTHVSDPMLRTEIASTVRELLVRYPEKKPITIGIFGNPSEIEKGRFNEAIRLSVISGFSKKEKDKFFSTCVVPLFKSRFGGLHV